MFAVEPIGAARRTEVAIERFKHALALRTCRPHTPGGRTAGSGSQTSDMQTITIIHIKGVTQWLTNTVPSEAPSTSSLRLASSPRFLPAS